MQQSITPLSFLAKAWVKNGRVVCRGTWSEYLDETKQKTETIEHLVNYDETKVFSLPDNLINLERTEVTYYDNSTFVTSDAYFKNNYIEFNIRPLEKVIDIRFKKD